MPLATEQTARVIVDLAIEKPLDYLIPPELNVSPGAQVEVPVRGNLRKGIVLEVREKSSHPLLPIHSVGDVLPPDLLKLAKWMSHYYAASFFGVLKLIYPSSIRNKGAPKEQQFVQRNKTRSELRELCVSLRSSKPQQALVLDVLLRAKKGLLLTELLELAQVSRSPVETLAKNGAITIKKVLIDRSPLQGEEYFRSSPKKLNEDQEKALQSIRSSIDQGTFNPHLLYGVTGSGKTEVYLQAIESVIQKGKSAIMLVPEISLTTQTIEKFRCRFSEPMAILHHRLSHGERFDEWKKINRGEVSIVIGARSALFAPLPNLGLLIIDEEHDGAYKQSDGLCYNGRDVAVMRAHFAKIPILLGSATPSLESFYNAKAGKYHLNCLTKRAANAHLPKVEIVDMQKAFERSGGYTLFSDVLIEKIKERFENGEQTILFLNRRGYHTSVVCPKCSHLCECERCSIAMTFHRSARTLACHLCGTEKTPPKVCPSCGHTDLKFKGVGTEQVERALHAIFPTIRTLRMDGDTTRHKGSHERLFREFSTGKSDLLIGTQMITKGLHFPSVTLVAILNSDAGLQIPDFRASERTFQLITQVAGRAGRGSLPGEVIIQTHMPDHLTIKLAASQNYEAFYEAEIESRRLFNFPPTSHLVKLTFSSKNEEEAFLQADRVRQRLLSSLPQGYTLHPIQPSGHPKVKDYFRYQFLIRGQDVYPIAHAIKALPSSKRASMQIDVDPLNTFF